MQDVGFDKNVDVKMSVAVVRCTRYSDGCLFTVQPKTTIQPRLDSVHTVQEQREGGEEKME